MSAQAATSKKCSRCGTVVEACAFCDEPDCPEITCHRCLSTALFDRVKPKSTHSSPTQR